LLLSHCFGYFLIGFGIGSRAMSKSVEQEMSVLSSSKHGLVYLTANDWALVADKASRVHFRKGQALVHQGIKTDGIYWSDPFEWDRKEIPRLPFAEFCSTNGVFGSSMSMAGEAEASSAGEQLAKEYSAGNSSHR
jgi:hypothetical protein